MKKMVVNNKVGVNASQEFETGDKARTSDSEPAAIASNLPTPTAQDVHESTQHFFNANSTHEDAAAAASPIGALSIVTKSQ